MSFHPFYVSINSSNIECPRLYICFNTNSTNGGDFHPLEFVPGEFYRLSCVLAQIIQNNVPG